jgi:hypothetical protein
MTMSSKDAERLQMRRKRHTMMHELERKVCTRRGAGMNRCNHEPTAIWCYLCHNLLVGAYW